MLERLEKLLADATPRPWRYDDGITDSESGERGKTPTIEAIGAYGGHELIVAPYGHVSWERDDANCRLIVAAVNALPALLAVVSEARLTADHLRTNFTAELGQGCCKNRIIALKSALSKLDEVQP